MPTSTVPAVWTALHSLIDAATSTTVHYGPPMAQSGDFVCVGYDGDGPAVTADTDWSQLGAQKQEERYGIACLIWVASGDTDMPVRVAAAYALLGVIAEALASDYTLGGTCRIARISETSNTPEQDAAGSSVRLAFTVTVQARI